MTSSTAPHPNPSQKPGGRAAPWSRRWTVLAAAALVLALAIAAIVVATRPTATTAGGTPGTIDAPTPLDTPVTIGSWEVTVTQVPVSNIEHIGIEPPEGMAWAHIRMSATNNGAGPARLDASFTMTYVDAGGNEWPSLDPVVPDEGDSLNLASGESGASVWTFLVPREDSNNVWHVIANDSSGGGYFAL